MSALSEKLYLDGRFHGIFARYKDVPLVLFWVYDTRLLEESGGLTGGMVNFSAKAANDINACRRT